MTDQIVEVSERNQPLVKYPTGVLAWLDDYALKIREVDYESARRLFDTGIFGFGTKKIDAYHSLDEWHHDQWAHVWSKTTGFQFHFNSLRTVLSADGSLCCTACEWDSKGIREDGLHFPRNGRCTILLARSTDNEFGWVGVHSHFSMVPG